jgi:hypothetical protein
MKMGAKKEDQVPLSGKEKAKMLKMMKEQSKQKEQAQTQTKPRPSAATAPKAPMQSGLPSNFFDVAPTANPASVVSDRRPGNSAISTNTAAPVADNTIGNLPKGFFDNPVEDLNARGISMDQYTAKMEKEEKAELDSFLSQLKGMEGEREQLEEASDLREESGREYEEEAAQMAYMANLIALRAQSEKISGQQSGSRDGMDDAGSEALDHLLREVAEVRTISKAPTNAALEVDAILYQKLAQNAAQKRKRDAILSNILSTADSAVGKIAQKPDSKSDSEDESESRDSSESESESDTGGVKKAKPTAKYTPLNFMNWTSRTL